jgi:hypothetical protein
MENVVDVWEKLAASFLKVEPEKEKYLRNVCNRYQIETAL